MEQRRKSGLATRAVHGGEQNIQGSPHTPIFNSTTFAFDTTRDLLNVVEGKKAGPLYTRYGMNPTLISLEEKLAGLEEAEGALLFASGMAAEAAIFFALGRKGIICLGDAYGGTMELLSSQFESLRIPWRNY
jgi:O-acetylhomoserine/O-acetylserine sulfhydrylase-like pyridoxal-dependent enzyme